MADAVLKNVRVGETLTDVTVTGGKIASLARTAADGRDCAGARLLPGLIDIHTHGMAGLDTMDGDLDALARAYLKTGVTAFLPTTMTRPLDEVAAVAENAKKVRGGAEIIGLHLEGPYLSPDAIGAQNKDYMRLPVYEEIAGIPGVKMVTVAPELAGAETFISACRAHGISVALGHTKADYDTASRAFRAGADNLTHTCNAMPPFLHRAPGPIGAALTSGGYAQVISDGVHLHPATVLALWRMFGRERMILVSDSMRATGLSDGDYDLGGQKMTVRDGVARTQDGALAGSTTPLYTCVLRAISFGIPSEDAFAMASETPARLLGLNKGKIEVGYDADFCLADEDYRLIEPLKLSE